MNIDDTAVLSPAPDRSILALDEAKGAYNDLLALWKNADPKILLVEEARAEYARLP